MPQKRSVDDVLPKNAVLNVRRETPGERILSQLLGDNSLKPVGAFIVLVLGLLSTLIIMAVSDSLRMYGFQLFNGVILGMLGYYVGAGARGSR